jgi:hypothetical protein
MPGGELSPLPLALACESAARDCPISHPLGSAPRARQTSLVRLLWDGPGSETPGSDARAWSAWYSFPVSCRGRAAGIPGIHQRCGPLAAQLEDTGGMNRERAGTFLRLLAEGELRRVTARPRDSAPLPDMPGAGRDKRQS